MGIWIFGIFFRKISKKEVLKIILSFEFWKELNLFFHTFTDFFRKFFLKICECFLENGKKFSEWDFGIWEFSQIPTPSLSFDPIFNDYYYFLTLCLIKIKPIHLLKNLGLFWVKKNWKYFSKYFFAVEFYPIFIDSATRLQKIYVIWSGHNVPHRNNGLRT